MSENDDEQPEQVIDGIRFSVTITVPDGPSPTENTTGKFVVEIGNSSPPDQGPGQFLSELANADQQRLSYDWPASGGRAMDMHEKMEMQERIARLHAGATEAVRESFDELQANEQRRTSNAAAARKHIGDKSRDLIISAAQRIAEQEGFDLEAVPRGQKTRMIEVVADLTGYSTETVKRYLPSRKST